MKRLADFYARLEESVIALLLAGMVLVTFSQVVARYVFNSGAVWALELTTFLFAWLVLLGASYGIRVNAHIGVDAFVQLFGTRARRIFGLIVVAAGLTYGVLVFIGSWAYVSRMYQIGIGAVDLPVPRWIPLSVLPIGLALIIARLLEAGWRIVSGRQAGMEVGDEGKAAIDQFADQFDDLELEGGELEGGGLDDVVGGGGSGEEKGK